MRPNCLVCFRVVPTKGWRPSWKNRMRSGFQSTGATKTFPKEKLNSTLGKEASAAWFWRLCWCKEGKAVTVRLKPVALTVCIKVILKLLVGLRVWDDWLQLGGTSLCRTLSLFLGTLGGGCGKDWTPCIACGWGLLFGGVLKSIWISVPDWTWRDISARARAWCHRSIAAEWGLVSLNWASPNGLADLLGLELLEL